MPVRKKVSALADEESLNITPLIDCVFLLLIFFMVTTVFKNPAKLKTQLPYAVNPTTLDKRQLVCELDADGNIALNGTVTSFDSFDAYLVSEKQKTGNNTLLIRADEATKHSDVLKIMKIARSVQIETIAMAVEHTSEE